MLLASGLGCEWASAAQRAVPATPGVWALMTMSTSSHRCGLPSGAAGTHSIPLIPQLIKAVNQFKLATNQYMGAEPKTTISKHRGQPHVSQRGRLLSPLATHLGQRPGRSPASF